MKTPDNRSGVARREGNGKARRARGDMDARTEARIRTVAAIVRHRQETLYDRLADRFRIAFAAGADKKRESMAMAAEKAREQLTAAGALTEQQGERLKAFLLRDLDHVATHLCEPGEPVAPRLRAARAGGGALESLATVLDALGEGLHDLAGRPQGALCFRTGEVTSAGILTCVHCGATMRFKQTGTVPPCAACSKTEFHKGY